MGNQKLKWTVEEEEALKAGVAKHGAGKWKTIIMDSEFAEKLAGRSNVDLKDKWRNMCANQGQGDSAATPKSDSDSKASESPQDDQDIPDEMILEAVSSIQGSNGATYGEIASFIEQKQELTPDLRRTLGSKLRKLISENALEKGQNRYKIKNAATDTNAPAQENPNAEPSPPQAREHIITTTDAKEAAEIAAQRVAEAENKTYLAAEAMLEAERISQMAEEAHEQLMQLEEIIEQFMPGLTGGNRNRD
ncbi:single myb histone 4-like [Andrographis paniculata]|uniref:single myb histone 4-like n=1 Tax=Andrographis paniculata TaxID=175694 RepID=UPI0021E86606|nr:single myb histone 4-like [Andrographis paniculata]